MQSRDIAYHLRRKHKQPKKKKKKERWNWDDQSKAVMKPMTEQKTFKQFLEDRDWDAGYNYEGPQRDFDLEDWQDDVDGADRVIGVCPMCHGEARYVTTGSSLKDAEAHWECQECGHEGKRQGY